MKFVVGENGRIPVKNLSRPRFVHQETHMEGPRRELGTPAVGGERLTACATRPYTVFFHDDQSRVFLVLIFFYFFAKKISEFCIVLNSLSNSRKFRG